MFDPIYGDSAPQSGGALSYLFQGQAAPAVATSAAGANNLPDWYTQYTRDLAGKAISAGANAEGQPVPQQSVAGFTPDQSQAFQQIRDNQGNWQNATGQALGQFGQAGGAAGRANAAVAGPSQNFTDNVSKYMSPYTSSVVNEIGRLGNQNFQENIMPQINASMIGSGQFGSTRNAEVLSNAGRDVQQNILGQQATALESGYGTAGTLFGQDANRAQQQQQTQASTALAGGALQNQTGQAMGALGQATQQMGLTDAQALQAAGQQQQQMQQTGLDTAYNNQVAMNNAPWTNLSNMSSLVRGVQLPSTQTAMNSGPLTRTYSQSPVSQLTSGTTGLFGR